jgi:uncharacterized protein (DUF1015 family)
LIGSDSHATPKTAEVRPFNALRYVAVDDLHRVLAPPYDVISPSDQDRLHAADPRNVIHLELARGSPNESVAGRYARAARDLAGWRRQNVIARDAAPAMYVYEERFDVGGRTGTRRGFFGALRLHPWAERVVLPHERTRPKPKADRLALLQATGVQFSPILTMFEDGVGDASAAMDEVTRQRPIACATLPQWMAREIAREHTLWRADEASTRRLASAVGRGTVFIADGHHRYETALEYGRVLGHAASENTDAIHGFIMALLVPVSDPGLAVLPTHRLVNVPPGTALAEVRAVLARTCTIHAVARIDSPDGSHPGLVSAMASRADRRAFGALGLFEDSDAVVVPRSPPPGWSAPATWHDLDVGLLEGMVVEPLLHAFPGTTIEFTRDAGEAAVHSREQDRLAFLLNPTTVQDVVRVARAGDRMPEKSTYFMPKVATGLVMYPVR